MSAWENLGTVCVRARNQAVHDVALRSVGAASSMAIAMLAPVGFVAALGFVFMLMHAGVVGVSLAWALQWHRAVVICRERQDV